MWKNCTTGTFHPSIFFFPIPQIQPQSTLEMILHTSYHLNPFFFSISNGSRKSKQFVIPCSGNATSIDNVRSLKLCNSRNKVTITHLSYSLPSYILDGSHIVSAKKNKNDGSEPFLSPSIVEEVMIDDDEDELIIDEFEDDELLDDGGDFGDDYFEEDAESYAGDGSGGGGTALAGTTWDKNALSIAEEVVLTFDGELGIYAFKTLLNATIQVRIERLTTKSGSPTMLDIEAFTRAYRSRLDEAVVAGSIPENISLEVSSPGVERIVRIPLDLERFKDRPMYVKYVAEAAKTDSLSANDGIFRLVSLDLDTQCCTWGLADVRVNREKAGKGRPLSKKQREWRLETPFDTLQLVRIHSEC